MLNAFRLFLMIFENSALTIRVISASNLASSSFVGKVNPFAIIKIGTQEQQTKVVQDGGKKPVWGDTFDFSISTEKELNLRVMDKADVGQPKFIGQTTVSIMQWLAKGSFDGEIEIQDQKGTPSGSVSLSVKFSKPGAGAPPPPPGKPGPPMPGNPVKGAAAPGYEPPRDPNGKFTDHEIKEAFEAFDLDHNHFVGAAELRHVLINIGEQVTGTFKKMKKSLDLNVMDTTFTILYSCNYCYTTFLQFISLVMFFSVTISSK